MVISLLILMVSLYVKVEFDMVHRSMLNTKIFILTGLSKLMYTLKYHFFYHSVPEGYHPNGSNKHPQAHKENFVRPTFLCDTSIHAYRLITIAV